MYTIAAACPQQQMDSADHRIANINHVQASFRNERYSVSDTAIYFALIAFHVEIRARAILGHNIRTTSNPTSGVLHQQLLQHPAPHLYIRLVLVFAGVREVAVRPPVSPSDARANNRRGTFELHNLVHSKVVEKVIEKKKVRLPYVETFVSRDWIEQPQRRFQSPNGGAWPCKNANVTHHFQSDPHSIFLRYQPPIMQARSGDPARGQPGLTRLCLESAFSYVG